ncbi:hypothetical protein [Paenibacillus sp. F411]|nr:hypothetical protein [Paenibacillus sp. F411]
MNEMKPMLDQVLYKLLEAVCEAERCRSAAERTAGYAENAG